MTHFCVFSVTFSLLVIYLIPCNHHTYWNYIILKCLKINSAPVNFTNRIYIFKVLNIETNI